MGAHGTGEQEFCPRRLSLACRQERAQAAVIQKILPQELRLMKELVAIAETIAVAESATGGLISASLLAVPGASAYCLGSAVVYTRDARRILMDIPDEAMK